MLAFTIGITDTATPRLRELADQLKGENIAPRLGVAGQRLLIDFYADLNAQRPNALGGTRTGYYADAGRKSFYRIETNGVTIGTSQVGMSQHYFGGDLTEANLKNSKFFTIPARSEAHGHTASEFDHLVVLWGKHGPFALAMTVTEGRDLMRGEKAKLGEHVGLIKGDKKSQDERNASSHGEVMFWLTARIHFTADPSVFPSVEQFEAVCVAALEALLARGKN